MGRFGPPLTFQGRKTFNLLAGLLIFTRGLGFIGRRRARRQRLRDQALASGDVLPGYANFVRKATI